MPDDNIITVQPINPGDESPIRWQPVEGEQTREVLRRALSDDSAREAVLQSSAEILGRGVSPIDGAGSKTGLVVGYVQSGKTLSFTTAIGLARDNNFPLVIVIAGTKTHLLSQSAERLDSDLDTESLLGGDVWRPLKNPSNGTAATIRQALAEWRDADAEPDERPGLFNALNCSST